MNPTKEQQAVIDATGDKLKMIAYAGTGKTSTFVERAKAHPERMLYLAFNKSVELEAKERFPSNVLAKTTHALAYAAIIGRGGKYKLGKLSIFKTAKHFRIDYYLSSLIHKTLETWCNSADTEISKVHAAPDAINRYPYDITAKEVEIATKVWHLVLAAQNPNFPMTHSGYLKMYQLSKPVLKYDSIMLDEAQDTNPVTQDIVMRQAEHGVKILLAGDPYQQIYSWRGAVDALQKVEADPFYITQSFRFGPEVAGVANTILNTFFGEERKLVGLGPGGTVTHQKPAAPYTYISRTNAFLFAHACGLAGQYKLYTPGTQYGNLPLFDSVMNVYHLWNNDKYQIRDPELKFFNDFWEFQEFVQTGNADAEYTVSEAIVSKYKEDVPAQIERVKQSLVPTARQADIVLTTAHRAKGMEWDNVILCEDFRSLYDDETGELRKVGPNPKTEIGAEEINLLYVAATRAMKCLVPNSDLAQLVGV